MRAGLQSLRLFSCRASGECSAASSAGRARAELAAASVPRLEHAWQPAAAAVGGSAAHLNHSTRRPPTCPLSPPGAKHALRYPTNARPAAVPLCHRHRRRRRLRGAKALRWPSQRPAAGGVREIVRHAARTARTAAAACTAASTQREGRRRHGRPGPGAGAACAGGACSRRAALLAARERSCARRRPRSG